MTMTIAKELLDELLKDCERPEDLLGDAGLMKEFKFKLIERKLGAELTAHLGHDEGKHTPSSQPETCRPDQRGCAVLHPAEGILG